MSQKIYAPNVHLFAFHLRDTSDTHYQNGLLWEKCRQIFPKFNIFEQLQIREVPEDERVDLLEGATDENILLPLIGEISTPSGEIRIGGSACPLQIYDSFALWLSLWIPKLDENNERTAEVETSVFQDFNPDGCLLSRNIGSSLGQTLLLTAWLSAQQQRQGLGEWRAIATECVQHFLNESNPQNLPPLYQEGFLFGSPIFEYGVPDKPSRSGTIFVWLFFPTSATEERFNKYDQAFIDIFFYRQKIIEAYLLSRAAYKDIRQGYTTIQNTIKDIAPKLPNADAAGANPGERLSENDLSHFKEKLRTLPKLDLEYTDLLEELERYRVTIEVNSKNYAAKLRQIKDKSPEANLRFLVFFYQKNSQKFSKQIQVDLEYFSSRSSLVDKAIAAIRGLVEIEQAEILKKSEADEKERDRALQNTIQAVGAGIGAGIGAAQILTGSYALIKSEDPLLIPGQKNAKIVHPFVSSIFWSVVVGAGLGLLTWWLIKYFLNKADTKKPGSEG